MGFARLIYTSQPNDILDLGPMSMICDSERRRVLIGTSSEHQNIFRDLFRRHPLERWVIREASSFSRARFVLEHEPCDVLLVNDDLYEREGGQGLAWLAWQRELPIVLLIGQSPETYARAYQLGVSVCLPCDQVLAHPPILSGALDQAVRICEMRFGYQRIKEQLRGKVAGIPIAWSTCCGAARRTVAMNNFIHNVSCWRGSGKNWPGPKGMASR